MCVWVAGTSLQCIWRQVRLSEITTQGAARKNIPGTTVAFFFQGVPPEGEGGTNKNLQKFFRAESTEIS